MNNASLSAWFGQFGGQFVAETLMGPLEELEHGYEAAIADPVFCQRRSQLLKDFIGRPTPLTKLQRLTDPKLGATIYLKREDLAHTGAHKINNATIQALLAQRMGKTRIVAETGAGQHGVATATACAMLGLKCVIYMGAVDAARQAPNVQRMKILGAQVHLVTSGSQTLKDSINEAIRDWISNIHDTHYSNAMGIFSGFVNDPHVRLIGVQAGGTGLAVGEHSCPLLYGDIGLLHGAKTFILQDDDGQIQKSHSIAPGLDYPGVGPEHSHLKASGRAEYVSIDDEEALAAFQRLALTEGILPALESSHALAYGMKLAKVLGSGKVILVNLSGRGDKDLTSALAALETRKK